MVVVSGSQDGQRVEVMGQVRGVRPAGPRTLFETAVDGYRLRVFSRFPPDSPKSLVGAWVRIRGTVTASYNSRLRRLTDVNIYVSQPEDLDVLSVETDFPFAEPPLPIRSLAQYHPDMDPSKRIHLRGTVTFQGPGRDLYIQDATGGLRIHCLYRDEGLARRCRGCGRVPPVRPQPAFPRGR